MCAGNAVFEDRRILILPDTFDEIVNFIRKNDDSERKY
jgi:hypothetical protein